MYSRVNLIDHQLLDPSTLIYTYRYAHIELVLLTWHGMEKSNGDLSVYSAALFLIRVMNYLKTNAWACISENYPWKDDDDDRTGDYIPAYSELAQSISGSRSIR